MTFVILPDMSITWSLFKEAGPSGNAIRGWWGWAHLNVRMVRMAAYSMMVLKMVRMQVTMKLSIAFRLLDEDEGASALHEKRI